MSHLNEIHPPTCCQCFGYAESPRLVVLHPDTLLKICLCSEQCFNSWKERKMKDKIDVLPTYCPISRRIIRITIIDYED